MTFTRSPTKNDKDLKPFGKIPSWGSLVPSETKRAYVYPVSLMNKSRASWILFFVLVICMDLEDNSKSEKPKAMSELFLIFIL